MLGAIAGAASSILGGAGGGSNPLTSMLGGQNGNNEAELIAKGIEIGKNQASENSGGSNYLQQSAGSIFS